MIELKDIKTVAVTGATGFIANPLISKLLAYGIHVHAIARNEGDLVALQSKFPSISIFPCPIEDEYLLRKACTNCEGIFHLAAVKGVTVAEKHPLKTVQTNIIGTTNILKLSVDLKLKFVIAASSDKAEKVSGVYGATKFMMEKLFHEFDSFNGEGCQYRVIRFGNVFYSTGSVLDVWRNALLNGESIHITDPESTRFFWTKEAAIEALINCLEDAKDARPYVPHLKSVTIGDLMGQMIDLYGNASTQWNVVGLREGENKHELLREEYSSEFAKKWDQEDLRNALMNTEN